MSSRLLRSSAGYAVARGLPGVLNFIALAVFTRLLSAEEYGAYALVVAAVMLLYACCFQWLGLAVLRLLPGTQPARQAFLATVLRVFRNIVIGVGGPAFIAAALWMSDTGAGLRLAGVLLLITLAWHELNLLVVTAGHRPSRYALLAGLRSVVGLACGTMAAVAGLGVVGVLGGIIAGYAVAGAVAYSLNWRGVSGHVADSAVRRSLLTYGIPLAAAYLLDYVVSSSDRLLLGIMMSTEASGLYSPAYDLCQQLLWAFMMIINLAAYPIAVRAMESGDAEARGRQLGHHFLLLAAVAFPAAAGLAVLAPSASGLLGPSFAPVASAIIPVIAVALLIGGMKSFYFDLSFQLGRATRMQLATVAVAAAVNLGLNVALIPRLGIAGAAWATLAAYTMALVASVWLGRRVLVLPVPWVGLGRIGLAVTGMILVLLPLRGYVGMLALAGQVLAGASAYGGLLYMLNKGRFGGILTSA